MAPSATDTSTRSQTAPRRVRARSEVPSGDQSSRLTGSFIVSCLRAAEPFVGRISTTRPPSGPSNAVLQAISLPSGERTTATQPVFSATTRSSPVTRSCRPILWLTCQSMKTRLRPSALSFPAVTLTGGRPRQAVDQTGVDRPGWSARRQMPARLCHRVLLVGEIAHHALVGTRRLARLRVAELLVALAQVHPRLRRHGAVRALRQLLELLGCALQVAFHLFLVDRRLELDLGRSPALTENDGRREHDPPRRWSQSSSSSNPPCLGG